MAERKSSETKEAERSPYLTREEMEAVLASGGTVLHRGVHITHPEHLPTKAELAGGDEERLREAEADWQRRMATLQAERAQLGDRTEGAKSTPEGATIGARAGAGATVPGPRAQEQP